MFFALRGAFARQRLPQVGAPPRLDAELRVDLGALVQRLGDLGVELALVRVAHERRLQEEELDPPLLRLERPEGEVEVQLLTAVHELPHRAEDRAQRAEDLVLAEVLGVADGELRVVDVLRGLEGAARVRLGVDELVRAAEGLAQDEHGPHGLVVQRAQDLPREVPEVYALRALVRPEVLQEPGVVRRPALPQHILLLVLLPLRQVGVAHADLQQPLQRDLRRHLSPRLRRPPR
mmetsp:Transcript_16585/g.50916  ORF Transcript_16585/g.50916 Transcript_16585/m.50916 type:complete len:234 (-) Transcript_16585:235-936(-)